MAIVESYPPYMRAGSEIAMHQTLRELVRTYGYEATVGVTQNGPFVQQPFKSYDLDGIWVFPYDDILREQVPDIVFTHLYAAVHFARSYAERNGCKFVYFDHTTAGPPGAFDLVVFNAAYRAGRYPRRHIIFHPPVWPADYEVKRPNATKITRIGLSPQKGGNLFWALAERFPGKEFLGVTGGWGPQITENPNGNRTANVTVVPNTDDMRSVYRQTRILIMPSDLHETWGRIGVEAMCSGIPVIASGIPSLRESLSFAGIFCDLYRMEDWVDMIKCVDDPKNYECHSRLAYERAKQLHPRAGFDALADALGSL